jgi:pectate disaccharide-lyase
MHPHALDPRLVSAAQSGDRHALESLFTGHLPLVYSVVGRALDGHSDVDDVVQETMLRAVTALPQLREPDRFRSWLISIAIRQTQERGRSRGATLARQQPFEDWPEVPDPAADPAGETIARVSLSTQRREVAAAAQWLTPADRDLLALWWQEVAGTLTRADLAEALEISTSHAAVRIQRMRAQLDLARSLVRAWHARPRCAELTTVAKDGRKRDLKRLGRHVRDCDACRDIDGLLVPADRLLTTAAFVPVPVLLAGKIADLLATATVPAAAPTGISLAAAADGITRTSAHVKPLVLGGSALTAATVAAVLAVNYSSAPPPKTEATRRPSATAAPIASPTPSEKKRSGPVTGVTKADVYVAPGGRDTNPGTLAAPLASLGKAVERVRPGQTIAMRAGTYRPTSPVTISTSGTATKRIMLSNYRNETPVIDASRIKSDQWYVTQRASYWTVQGLTVHGSPSNPYLCFSCAHNVFQRLTMYDNGGTGLELRGPNTIGNRVLNSDFHDNHDDARQGANADGVAIKEGSGTGNLVSGCRVYRNADDGLDLSGFSDPVTITHNWAYGNGHNRWRLTDFAGAGTGFKLGGGDPVPAVAHLVTENAAWDNRTFGFTEQNNKGPIKVTRNTAYRNGNDGFAFWFSIAVLRGNLALANGRNDNRGDVTRETGNSWDQAGWTTAMLRSTNPSQAEGARPANGSLPRTKFLTTKRKGIGATMSP